MKQLCFNPFLFSPADSKTSDDNTMEIIFYPNLIYTMAIFLIFAVFRIRNWMQVIPFAVPFIRPPKRVRHLFEWADVIQVEGPWLFPWVAKYSEKPIIYIAHNTEYCLASSILEHKCKKHPEFIKKKLMEKLFKTEEAAVRQSELVFSVNENDKINFISLYGALPEKIIMIPNGINTELYKKRAVHSHTILPSGYKYSVIFTGSKHPPNILAAKFIIEVLAPGLKEMGVLFIIAGSVCEKHCKDNILCTGAVSSGEMYSYLHQADMAINPVPYGSGSNIKMFEYLAASLPVVSTANGAEGVCDKGKSCVIVSDNEKFIQEIKSLLEDESRLERLGKLADDCVQYHDYSYIAESALNIYNEHFNR